MIKLKIEDRFELEDLIANYGWSLDMGEVEAFIDCFHQDAIISEEVFEEPDIWEGHEGIRRLINHYMSADGFPGRQHHVTQIQYLPQADGTVKMRSFAFVTECEGEPPYLLRFTGWYDDHAVKCEDGRWRFKRRTIRLWDGEVLRNFPGRGTWEPRRRPDSLRIIS